MLHIFHIDVGSMLAFDTGLTMKSVSNLQDDIFKVTGIPICDQVLLASGGFALDLHQRVAAYSGAGTESNPIFLVTRSHNQLPNVCSSSVSSGSSVNLSHGSCQQYQQQYPPQCATSFAVSQSVSNQKELFQQFSDILHTPSVVANFEGIHRLTELAKRIAIATENDAQLCSQLVIEQHLLQQGWFAVVANFDDTVSSFTGRVTKFCDQYAKYLRRRGVATNILCNFNASLELLGKIPLLSCFLPQNAQILSAVQQQSDETLLSWISSKDPSHSLSEVAQEAVEFLEQYDEKARDELYDLAVRVSQQANEQQMKEIKGLPERLSQLDQNLYKIGLLQKDQHDHCQSLINQEQKLTSYGDRTMVPHIWESHKDAVQKILKRYSELKEYCKCFHDAKLELLNNIRIRLNWVAFVQGDICNVDNSIVLCIEKLRRMKHQLQIIRQIHDAPSIYVTSISEIHRRRQFSTEFLAWSSELSEKVRGLRDKEMKLRHSFALKVGHHFLTALFPGLHDIPPEFAAIAPSPFDKDLPAITDDHIRLLLQAVPLFGDSLKVCKANVYEQLSVAKLAATIAAAVDENDSCTAAAQLLQREPSFLSETPPKYLFSHVRSKSLLMSTASSGWLSGDESAAEAFSPPEQLRFHSVLQQRKAKDDVPTTTLATVSKAESPKVRRRNTADSYNLRCRPRSFMCSPPEDPGCFSINNEMDTLSLDIVSLGPFSSAPISIPVGPGGAFAMAASSSLPTVSRPYDIAQRTRQQPKLEHSRQISERSSKFGTPEESLPILTEIHDSDGLHCDDDVLEATAGAFGHKRSVFKRPTSAAASVGPRTAGANNNGTNNVSATVFKRDAERVVQVVSPTQSDIISDLGGMLLDGSSSDSCSKDGSQVAVSTSTIEVAEEKRQLIQERTKLEQKLREVEKELAFSQQNARENLVKVEIFYKTLLSVMKLVKSNLKELRSELANDKTELISANAVIVADLTDNFSRLLSSTNSLDNYFKQDLTKSLSQGFDSERSKLEREITLLRTQLSEQVEEAEEKINALQSTVNEREDVIKKATEEERMYAVQELANVKATCEQAKAELIKQLTIDHELELERLRTDFEMVVGEKDGLLQSAMTELRDRDRVIVHMRSEQDRLLESLLERECVVEGVNTVFGTCASLESNEQSLSHRCEQLEAQLSKLSEEHETAVKTLRSELENNYKDKLQFLQSGLEERHKSIIDRKDMEFRLERNKLEKAITELKDPYEKKIHDLELTLQQRQSSGKTSESQYTTPTADVAVGTTEELLQYGFVNVVTQQPKAESKVQSSESKGETLKSPMSKVVTVVESQPLQQQIGKRPETLLTMSTSSAFSVEGKISVLSAHEGDLVLIVYHERFKSYVVFSTLPILHFIDISSYEGLGLTPASYNSASASVACNPSTPNSESCDEASKAAKEQAEAVKPWVLGRITKKDMCIAKRDRNRFNVPKDTKFCLITAVPYCPPCPKRKISASSSNSHQMQPPQLQ